MSCKCKESVKVSFSPEWKDKPTYTIQRVLQPDSTSDILDIDLRPNQGIRYHSTNSFIMQMTVGSDTVNFAVGNPTLTALNNILDLSRYQNIKFFAIPSASSGQTVFLTIDVYDRV